MPAKPWIESPEVTTESRPMKDITAIATVRRV